MFSNVVKSKTFFCYFPAKFFYTKLDRTQLNPVCNGAKRSTPSPSPGQPTLIKNSLHTLYSFCPGARALRTEAPIQTALCILKRLGIFRSRGGRGGRNKCRTIRAIGGTNTRQVQPHTVILTNKEDGFNATLCMLIALTGLRA